MKRMLLLLAATLSFVGGVAHAEYPDKPVRLIVPYIAGSAPDVAARPAAQRLGERLGQQFSSRTRPAPRAISAPRSRRAPRPTATRWCC
jgi:tripartite-type tricarboxylate transporter receptor subunit TctC